MISSIVAVRFRFFAGWMLVVDLDIGLRAMADWRKMRTQGVEHVGRLRRALSLSIRLQG